MLVEIDHMSDATAKASLARAGARGVAMVAGHTAFRDLQFMKETETDAHGKLAAENAKSLAQVQALQRLGGVVGVGTGPSDGTKSDFTRVANDCAGSSRSWVQLYSYAVHHKQAIPLTSDPRFVGVAIGTDMHLQGQLFPRFGSWACLGKLPNQWDHTTVDAKRPDTRRTDPESQGQAVSYKTPARTWWSQRFMTPENPMVVPARGAGPYNYVERAFWQALIMHEAGVNVTDPNVVAQMNTGWDWGHDINRAIQFAIGLAQTSAHQSHSNLPVGGCHDVNPLNQHKYQCDYTFGTDCFGCGERRAAYLARAGRFAPEPGDIASVQASVKAYMPALLRVLRKYDEMKRGGNPTSPLERCEGRDCGGNREFDYNLDGLAHYGLIPDMLQDASNQMRYAGGEVPDLRALMRSAEDYLQSWERVWARRR